MRSKYLISGFLFLLLSLFAFKVNGEIHKQERKEANDFNGSGVGNDDLSDVTNDSNQKIPTYEEIENATEAFRRSITNSYRQSSRRRKIKQKCYPLRIEYRIFTLIARDILPYNRIYPAWNSKATQDQKISFLNDTLKELNLRPLPFCKNKIELNLNPEKLDFFTTTLVPFTTLKLTTTTTNIEPDICNMEKIRSQVKAYVNDGSLSLWTVLRIRNSNINKRKKLQLINESLIAAGLPALAPCTKNYPKTKENKKRTGKT